MQSYANKRKPVAAQAAMQGTQEHPTTAEELLRASHADAPQPLSPELREKFESGFSADFANIRVSRGYIPPEMGVQAVARGTDILIDRSAGEDVLGHELAHVVQQAQGRVGGGYPVVNDASLEHEADVQGARVAAGGQATDAWAGGDMMHIPAMSDASAPAQCKSVKEKKAERAAKKQADRDFENGAFQPADPRMKPIKAPGPMVPDFAPPHLDQMNQLTNIEDLIHGTHKKKHHTRRRPPSVDITQTINDDVDDDNLLGLSPEELAADVTPYGEAMDAPALEEDMLDLSSLRPRARKKKRKPIRFENEEDDWQSSAAEAEALGPAPAAPVEAMTPPSEPAPEAPYFTPEMEEMLSAPRPRKKKSRRTPLTDD